MVGFGGKKKSLNINKRYIASKNDGGIAKLFQRIDKVVLHIISQSCTTNNNCVRSLSY